ncbi:uncharacterized protein LOC142341283 [Convolutriloba macropyga]|uniref:uncharacterized protein LOC142341283 n=1 Tax=Convolutriloba macropyga TaxID=536237 RepID=UPI003F520151
MHQMQTQERPPMADLPRERLDEHVLPFTHTGVNYFGPIEVKFLRPAVTRFIARRGYPSTINSDNGTNFVRAAKELKEFMDEWDGAKIESDLAQKKIIWKFNPPGAPHFGGIRERLVQSC